MASTRPTPAPAPWAEKLFTFGVTGTNGKTSTVHMILAVVEATGEPTLGVSTLGYALDGEPLTVRGSAKDFLDAAQALHERGGRFAVVECTSESLAAGYARRWRFDLGVFTHLMPGEHQQAHGSWEHYLASKAQLFTHLGPGRTAVLNAADPHAMLLDRVIPKDVQRRWYAAPSRGPALLSTAETPGASLDLAATSVIASPSGTRIELAPSPWAEALGGVLETRLVGEVFGENALAAACAGLGAGIPGVLVASGLAACPPVAGRFEVLARSPTVVVDYAHTPDALARTCDAARQIVPGRLWVVFGVGGGAPGKCEPMGEAVGARADEAIVTNDNPRDDDPQQIAEAVLAGVRRGGRARARVELDRRRAIEQAIDDAGIDDIVVVAGKGHETGQTVAGQTRPFSDREEVLRVTGSH